MAGNVPAGSMSTEIKLNGSQSVHTLRELKEAVQKATSAWKAQRAELSSIGKSTQAAEAKYKGLAETIKKQKDYIQGLQITQKKLQTAQKNVDRSTKDGREAYLKYNEALQKNETRIHSAETRLSSLSSQQNKARKSLDYYKSGLASVQKELKSSTSLNRSLVERLQAEGKTYEASRTKLNGYKSSIENLTKQEKIQAQELARIGKESGEASDAYKKQQIRVNETATSLAKAKNQMNNLDNSMKKANPSFLDRIKSKLGGVNQEANKTHKTFKEAFMGSALGNALSNSLSNVTSGLASAYHEGMDLNAAVAKINGRFKGMGLSSRAIRSLDKQIDTLKENTNMTGENVADLQTKMINWSRIGTKGAMQMTKTIAGISDSSKMSGDEVARMSAGLMRVGSTGKVTFSSLNRITRTAPTFYAQLAKGAGMSESHLKSLLRSGKVTQKQFQEWMAAASKYSDTAFKGFGKTQGGAIKYMQERWKKLEKDMTAPIFNAKTSGLQALKDLMSSPEITNGAKAIGRGISGVIGYLDKHKKDITDVAKDLVKITSTIGKDLWKDFAGIVTDIGKSFGLISGNASKSANPLHSVRLAMDGLAKNKQAIQWIAKAIELMAAAKLVNTANGLFHITGIAKGGVSAIVGFAKGFKGIEDVSKLSGTARVFSHIGSGVKKLIHPINSLTNLWDKSLIHFSNIKTKVAPVFQAFSKGFSKVKGVAIKAGSGIIKGVKVGAKGIGKAGKWIGGKLSSGFKGAVHIAKAVGSKIASAAKALGSKALSLGKKLGSAISKGIKASTKFSLGKRMATGAIAGGAVAVPEVINAVKDRHSADKRSQDIGGAVGALAGGTLTSMIPVVGPMLAPIGAIIGKYAGRWGGQAVNKFTKGWQRNKPPKKFWSLENLGWSTHHMFQQVGQWGAKVGRNFGKGIGKAKSFVHKNGKLIALAITNPLIGVPALLYKTNPKFRKWANGIAKNIKGGFDKAKKNVHNFNRAVGKNIGNFAKSANKKYHQFTSGVGRVFKKGWDAIYKHSSRGSKQVMRATSKFAKRYVRANRKANADTAKNFGNFGKRLKKDHGNLFTAIGQTTRKQLSIEKKHWSTNWKNIHTFVKGVWKGMRTNAHDFYNTLNRFTHGGLGKVISGFKSFGSGIKSFWSGLWSGLKNTVKTAMADINGSIKNVKDFFSGKLKVGNLHLAGGTDWRDRYGIPAVVNDAPGSEYREGLLDHGNLIPFPDKRNLPFWLLPGQDIVNGSDMAKIFGHAIHFANGTKDLRSFSIKDLNKLLVKNNDLATKYLTIAKNEVKKRDKRYQEHKEHRDKLDQRRDQKDHESSASKARREKAAKEAARDRSTLKKLGARISNAIKHHELSEAKKLTTEFNKVDSRLAKERKASKKPNPHAGKTLVDEGLLIGANSRIGRSKWISNALFKKLTSAPKTKKKKKRKTKKRKTKRRKTKRRKSSSSTRTTRTISRTSARVSATVSGGSAVKALSRAIKAIKSKHVKITASASGGKSISSLASSVKKIGGSHTISVKASGTRAVKALAKAVRKIKGGKHKVTVKVSGTKAVKSLRKAMRKIKGATHHVRVKTSGAKQLRALGKEITDVHKRVTSITKALKKDTFGKSIAKQAEEAVKSLRGKGNFAKQFSKMVKSFENNLKKMTKEAKSQFSKMWSEIKKTSNSGESSLTSRLRSFSSHYKHGWSSLESAIRGTFSHFWSNMRRAAGHGVNNVIKVLNNAISSIDSVIANFGGSKHAVGHAGYVHYASGTDANGRLLHDTLAIVNDAKNGPKQEAVVTDKNDIILPKGKNVPFILKKGWGVLNGTQTQQLGLPHYASGTGLTLKELYHIAKHNWEHPTKTGQSMFGAVTGLTGAINSLAHGMRSKGEDQGVKFWSQLWKMVEDKINDGDLGPAKGLLKAVEKLGHGKPYITGGYGLHARGYDCSGLVSTALQYYFHSGWGHQVVSGLWKHAHKIPKSEAEPGDPVFWLPDGHVGVYMGRNKYYSAFGPDIGVHSIWGQDPGARGPIFGRFIGINERGSDSDNKDVKVKANNALQKFIRPRVGKGFWKTVEKIQEKYGPKDDGGIAGKPSGDHAHWLKEAGIPRSWWHWMDLIISGTPSVPGEDTTWNPRAKNPTSTAYGIGQMLDFNYHYYRRHGSDWRTNPIAQLMGMKDYINDAYHGSAKAAWYKKAHTPSHWYANGGIASQPSIFGEAGPEMAVPLIPSKSTRAWELIGKAIGILSSQSGLNAQQNQVNLTEEKEEHDFRQAVLLLLRQLLAKSNVADIKLTTPAGRKLWEVIQPFEKADLRDVQMKLRRGLSAR